MRRKSLAKYRMAASVNSPKDGLKTPTPFVSGTALSTSSGNSDLSRPTERECTQRRFGHILNTSLNRSSEPDQFNSTAASAATARNASGEFPATILAAGR